MAISTTSTYALIIILTVVGGIMYWLYRENIKSRSGADVLKLFSKDLTDLAKQQKLDPVIGREHEIERLIQILSRRTKNNPVLIGKSGVGKTAIVEGLANKIASRNVTAALKDKKVLSLDLSGLVAGTKYRGEFEKRLKALVDEIIAAKRQIILFIDEMHTLAEAGQASGAINAADILKPALARGDLQVIGATTMSDYKQYVEQDMTLERRFQPIMINEPNQELTLKILQGIKPRYELHHQVTITDAALEKSIALAAAQITDRVFPDKAIDLMDEACAKVKLRSIGQQSEHSEQPRVQAADVQAVMDEWQAIGMDIEREQSAA